VTFDPNEASAHDNRGRVVADRECVDDVIALRRQTDEPHLDPIAPFDKASALEQDDRPHRRVKANALFGRKEACRNAPTVTYSWLQREPAHTSATDNVAKCVCRYSTCGMDDTLV